MASLAVTKTPSVHRRLGNANLSQLAFPGEGNPNFALDRSHWDSTVLKTKAGQTLPPPPPRCLIQQKGGHSLLLSYLVWCSDVGRAIVFSKSLLPCWLSLTLCVYCHGLKLGSVTFYCSETIYLSPPSERQMSSANQRPRTNTPF